MNSVKRIILLFLIYFCTSSNVIFAAPDWEKEYCPKDKTVCITYSRKGSILDIYAQNKIPSEDIITTITFTQKGELKNLKGSSNMPLTLVCRGTEPLKAASFSIIDITKPWNVGLFWRWRYGSFEKEKGAEYAYSLPYAKGSRFRVSQAFNDIPTHNGKSAYSIDWAMPEGTPIYAARSGIVIYTEDKYSEGGFEEKYRDKGNGIEILHNDGTIAQYSHLKKNGVLVKKLDTVKEGDVIGYSGNTGYSRGPHLHFSISRPISGNDSSSIPFGFKTDYSEYDTIRKARFYSFTGISPKKQSAPGSIEIEDVHLCKTITDNHPHDKNDTFSSSEKFMIYTPIYPDKINKVEIKLYKSGKTPPVKKYARTPKKNSWWTAIFIDLSAIKNSSGEWRAEIFLNSKLIGEKKFFLK